MPHLQKSTVTKSFLCIIKKEVDNLREEVKKQNNTLDSPPLFFFFPVFRKGVIFRNFALGPVRFPGSRCLGCLHSGLQAFWCSKSRRGGGQEASLLLLVGFVILPG